MKNILLLNAHSAQNAGDLAILEESLKLLGTTWPEADVTVAINDVVPEQLPVGATYVGSFMRWLIETEPTGEWRWRKWMVFPYALWLVLAASAYRLVRVRLQPLHKAQQRLMNGYYDADVVVVIGGGHLYASHAWNISFFWLWLGLVLAVIMGKPLVFLPQSFGPLPGRVQRLLLRFLLHRSAFVAARERISKRFLRDIGVRTPILVAPDVAFGATSTAVPAETTQRKLGVSSNQRPTVGLTVMDWGGQNRQFEKQRAYETAVVRLVAHLQECYDAEIKLISQCYGPTPAQDDRNVACRIADRIGDTATVERLEARLTPAELRWSYSQLDALVATRMHSAIFAMSQMVPTLVIGYLHKSQGIMQMLALEQYILDIETIRPERLCRAFDQLWDNRSTVRSRLLERIPQCQDELRELPDYIRSSVTRYD